MLISGVTQIFHFGPKRLQRNFWLINTGNRKANSLTGTLHGE